jgi:hypothetical protein
MGLGTGDSLVEGIHIAPVDVRRRAVLLEDGRVAEPQLRVGVLLEDDDDEFPVALVSGVLLFQKALAKWSNTNVSQENISTYMSEVQIVADTPGIVTAAVLRGVIRREVRSLGIRAVPRSRVLTSAGDVCEDAEVAAGLVAVCLYAVDLGGLRVAGAVCEVPHSEIMVRIILGISIGWDTHGAAS